MEIWPRPLTPEGNPSKIKNDCLAAVAVIAGPANPAACFPEPPAHGQPGDGLDGKIRFSSAAEEGITTAAATGDHARPAALPAFVGQGAGGPSRSARARIRGFTLVEVLVAFVIAGLALAAMFNAVLIGLRTAQAASHYEQAVARARSRLAMAVHADPLIAGTWQGDDGGGFNWRVRVTPLATAKVQPIYRPVSRMAANFDVTLYAVTVWVAWHDGGRREVRLDTEQIGQGVQ